MDKKELMRRYAIFLAGVLCIAFGIAFITKATLGTSPVTAIPYSLSLYFPQMSLGEWTIFFNMSLVLAQWALLNKKAKKVELLIQAVFTFIFGYILDFALFCISAVEPHIYPAKILVLCCGCAILAFGAFLQLIGNVAMLPGDAFPRVIAEITKKEYGTIRVITDTTMASIAAILCLATLHALVGVREGTIICAVTVGNIVKFYKRHFKKLPEILLSHHQQ